MCLMMKDEGGGYCFSTDGQIYNWPFVIVESLSRLKSNQRRGGLLLDRRTYGLTFVTVESLS